jgi:hypothetical protein
MYCQCHKIVTFKQGAHDLASEAYEIVQAKSKSEFLDELSDIFYALGRLAGSAVRRPYVSMPFDARHVKKIGERVKEYSRIRSRRNLVDGACPCITTRQM